MDLVTEMSNLVASLQKYIGKSGNQLLNDLSITTSAKSKNYIIASNLCYQYKGKSYFNSLCSHANIHLKTIQLKENNKPQEAMSFATIDFDEIVLEEWNTSSFKNFLEGYFIFFVFKKIDNQNIVDKIFLWKMPVEDLNIVKNVWESTKNYIKNGNVIKDIVNEKVITNFISESDDLICHVRPHGKNGLDLIVLPVADKKTGYLGITKQSFWFNHNYLFRIINELED